MRVDTARTEGSMDASGLRVLIAGTGFDCRIQVPAFRAAGFDIGALTGTNCD